MGFRPLTRDSIADLPAVARAAAAPARLRWLAAIASVLLLGAILVQVYNRLSLTAGPTADSANALLQGQAMAHGNLLLRGWALSGASFYATDLPFNALLTVLHGLSPGVAHETGALIYAAVVVAATLLARGDATGMRAVTRMLVTFVLLAAPMPGQAVQILLLGPFHVGTTLILLLAFLMLDVAGRAPAAAVAFGLFLALALLSDGLALWAGAAPVIAVCGLRLARRQRPLAPDLALLTAAVLAIPAALVAGWVMRHMGAFMTVPLNATFVRIEDLPKNLGLTVEGLLVLFGANFFGQPLAEGRTLTIFVHLIGFAFVAFVAWWAAKDWRQGREQDRMTQVLLLAAALDVGAYLLSSQAIDLATTRYLTPAFVFGSVLAGRLGAERLWQSRHRGTGLVVAFAYVAFLYASLQAPPAPDSNGNLGHWLAAHNLRYGLADYWQASTVTVASGGKVRVRAIDLEAPKPSPYWWEAETAWYDPAVPGNDARFVLRDTGDSRSLTSQRVEAAFGAPAARYQVGQFEVMVWDRNVLKDIDTSDAPPISSSSDLRRGWTELLDQGLAEVRQVGRKP
jgi:hypothetical protein